MKKEISGYHGMIGDQEVFVIAETKKDAIDILSNNSQGQVCDLLSDEVKVLTISEDTTITTRSQVVEELTQKAIKEFEQELSKADKTRKTVLLTIKERYPKDVCDLIIEKYKEAGWFQVYCYPTDTLPCSTKLELSI